MWNDPPSVKRRKAFLKAIGSLFVLLLLLAVAFPYLTLLWSKFTEPPLVGEPLESTDTVRSETSQLILRLDIPMETLNAFANEKAPKSFEGQAKDQISAMDSDRIEWDVKRGDVVFKNTGKGLAAVVPFLKGQFDIRGDLSTPFGSIPVATTIRDVRGRVSAAAQPILSEDWSLTPNLNVDIDVEDATANLGPIRLQLAGLLEDGSNAFVDKMTDDLTDSFRESLLLKGSVERIWSQELNRVTQVENDIGLWLVTKPMNLAMAPIDYSDPTMISAATQIDVELALHARQPAAPRPVPLAPLKIHDLPERSHVRMPIVVPLEVLNEQLSQEGIEFTLPGGFEFDLTDPVVSMESSQFHLRIPFTMNKGLIGGSGVEGTFVLEAEPVLNLDKSKVIFKDLRLKTETDSLPEKALMAWAKPLIERELQTVDVQRLLDEAKVLANQEAQEWLSQYQEIEGEIAMETLSIDKIYLVRDASNDVAVVFVVDVFARAHARILFSGED